MCWKCNEWKPRVIAFANAIWERRWQTICRFEKWWLIAKCRFISKPSTWCSIAFCKAVPELKEGKIILWREIGERGPAICVLLPTCVQMWRAFYSAFVTDSTCDWTWQIKMLEQGLSWQSAYSINARKKCYRINACWWMISAFALIFMGDDLMLMLIN